MQHPCPRGVCPQRVTQAWQERCHHHACLGMRLGDALHTARHPPNLVHPHLMITSSPGCPCGLSDNMLLHPGIHGTPIPTIPTPARELPNASQTHSLPRCQPTGPVALRLLGLGPAPYPTGPTGHRGSRLGGGGVTPTKPHHVGFKPSVRGPLRPGPVSLPVASACKALNQLAGTSLGHSLRRSGNVPKVLPPLMPTPGQVQRQRAPTTGLAGPPVEHFSKEAACPGPPATWGLAG